MSSRHILIGFDTTGLSIGSKYVKRFDRRLRYLDKKFLGYNVMTIGEFNKLEDHNLNVDLLSKEYNLHRVAKEFGMMDPKPIIYEEKK